jgi:rSAM/selenodomain-associated transferase 2
MRLSIIMPVLDEATTIAAALGALAPMRQRGAELVVVDGGSMDDTVALARPFVDVMLKAPRGRAAQMNAGAREAKGDALLFLHADTRLPEDADRLVAAALARPGRYWGRFDVTLLGKPRILRVVAFMMNLRSRLTGIATGDQAIFMSADAFRKTGGYPDIALMEDIAISKALKRLSRPVALAARVDVSGRRFEAKGPMRLILLMWRLRLAYWLGADPSDLARRYGYVPRES